MSKWLIYLRKSRSDDPNDTIEEVLRKHEVRLQDYALKNFGYRIPESDIYREVVSGETIDDRPKIKELFSRMETEDIKGVLIVDVARLTRGDLLDCGTVVHCFRYTNTLVVTPMKTYDLSDKYDRKFFEMELTRGNDYLEYTKEILSAGRLSSKKKGNFISSVPPYGYDRVKIGKDWTLKPNEREAPYVKMAYEMYASGAGCYNIASRLEELGAKPRKADHFTEGVIRQILRNEVYCGKIKVGSRSTIKAMENGKIVKKRTRNKEYEVVDGKHEPIISEELFKKAQEKRGLVTKERSPLELKFLYAGLLKCGICGKAAQLFEADRNQKRRYYERIRCKQVRYCTNRSHNFHDVDLAIRNQLKAEFEDFSIKVKQNNQDHLNDTKNLLNELKKQLKEVDEKQEAICEYLESGVYSVEMFVSRNDKLEKERERLTQAIKKAETEIPNIKSMDEMVVTFHQTLDMLEDDSIPVKVKNNYLKKIIDVIYYTKDDNGIQIDIHMKV